MRQKEDCNYNSKGKNAGTNNIEDFKVMAMNEKRFVYIVHRPFWRLRLLKIIGTIHFFGMTTFGINVMPTKYHSSLENKGKRNENRKKYTENYKPKL